MTPVVSLSSYDYAVGPWALRLTGQTSALSALAERAVLRRLRFQLRLGPEAGDEANALATGSPAAVHAPPQPTTGFELSGQGDDWVNLTQLVQIYVQEYLAHQDLTHPPGLSQGPMTLAPVGLTRHRLTVAHRSGTDRGRAKATAVTLSMLQLVDLAAVLAQAEQAVEVLPATMMAAQRQRSWPRLPLWAGSVAAVLVAAVLGSQWLGQAPPAVVLAPGPTAERGSPPDEWVADEGNPAEVAAEGLAVEADGSEEPRPGSPPGATPLTAEADSGESRSLGRGLSPDPASTAPQARSDPMPPPATAGSRGIRDVNPPVFPPETTPTPPSPLGPSPDGGATPGNAGNPAPSPPRPERQTTRLAPLADSAPAAAPLAPETPASTPSAIPEVTPEAGGEGLARSDAPVADAPVADALVAEALVIVRHTLEPTWQPIPGLTSPLRYRLTLGPTGTVLAVDPLTAPSRPYLNQHPRLHLGDALPNVRLSTPLTVEVDLLPSGEVRVSPSPTGQP